MEQLVQGSIFKRDNVQMWQCAYGEMDIWGNGLMGLWALGAAAIEGNGHIDQ